MAARTDTSPSAERAPAPTGRMPWRHYLLNASLIVLGSLVVVLLGALGFRYFLPHNDPRRETITTPLVGDIIQVEVRNACGVDGLAGNVTAYLRDRGFDVVEFGNHTTTDLPQSLIIDRVGDLASARKVARVLGLPEDRVRQDIQPDYYLDASVLIGKDYPHLAPFQQP